MSTFYVGDGISGVRRWVFARVIFRLLPWAVAARIDPGLPNGWSWNVRVDGKGLYARHYS